MNTNRNAAPPSHYMQRRRARRAASGAPVSHADPASASADIETRHTYLTPVSGPSIRLASNAADSIDRPTKHALSARDACEPSQGWMAE